MTVGVLSFSLPLVEFSSIMLKLHGTIVFTTSVFYDWTEA